MPSSHSQDGFSRLWVSFLPDTIGNYFYYLLASFEFVLLRLDPMLTNGLHGSRARVCFLYSRGSGS